MSTDAMVDEIELDGDTRSLRNRPAVRSQRHSRLRPRRRDLRGHVGADPALDLRRHGRRHRHRQPLRLQHHHRQGGRARHALRLAIRARRLRLHLRRRRLWRIHHRHRLGRPARRLRTWSRRSPSPSASPTSPCCSPPTSTSSASCRSAPATPPSAIARATTRPACAAAGASPSPLRPSATPPCRSRAKSTASLSCPTIRQELDQDCFEAYNIQVQGLRRRLEASACEEGRDRRLRRPRFHTGAARRCPRLRPDGPQALRHHRRHHAGLRHHGSTPSPTPTR